MGWVGNGRLRLRSKELEILLYVDNLMVHLNFFPYLTCGRYAANVVWCALGTDIRPVGVNGVNLLFITHICMWNVAL